MAAITRRELDQSQCAVDHGGLAHVPGLDANHEALYFHASCHPPATTWARYEKGELIITCAAWVGDGRRCDREVIRIAVAEELTMMGWIIGARSALGAHNHFPAEADSIWAKPNVIAAHRECRPVYVKGPWPGAAPGPDLGETP